MTKLPVFLSAGFLLFFGQVAFADNQYDRLKAELKREKPVESSYISTSREEREEGDPLSIKESEQRKIDYCKLTPHEESCYEYRRSGRLAEVNRADACRKDPLGRYCRTRTDVRFNRMMRRQVTCRAGLNDPRCKVALSSTTRNGRK